MNENFLLQKEELEQQLQKTTFILQTQRQLINDFAKFNLFFPEYFANTPQSKEIVENSIERLLTELLLEGERRLLQLLYTIDIPEREFLSLLSSNTFLSSLSEKILLREAYKVFLRSKFSS